MHIKLERHWPNGLRTVKPKGFFSWQRQGTNSILLMLGWWSMHTDILLGKVVSGYHLQGWYLWMLLRQHRHGELSSNDLQGCRHWEWGGVRGGGLGRGGKNCKHQVLTVAEDFFKNVFGTICWSLEGMGWDFGGFEEVWQTAYVISAGQDLLRTYSEAGKADRKQATLKFVILNECK